MLVAGEETDEGLGTWCREAAAVAHQSSERERRESREGLAGTETGAGRRQTRVGYAGVQTRTSLSGRPCASHVL